ncbi:HAMP domain-containing histidine kinase [Halioglobus maricola]|uniref:histidine kinase n=1 Tax=Halioglobus maricola TaxID=2601894 RepID=A0A5P9NL54_9GAMM|nr:HAMP domain-containing sensor histidine kinase [Halioglobus maricola]QFU76561.1 HAMP domain-containing histidine kinase [Halioglobus maricola]
MNFREVVASLTFRYIAKYLLVLSAAVSALMVGLYTFYSYGYFRDLGSSIVEEHETLELIYRGQGRSGLVAYIGDQRENWYVDRFHYLIRDADGVKILGDLPAGTLYREFDDGWLGIELALLEWGEEVGVDFLAREVQLDDELFAVVARNLNEVGEQGRLIAGMLYRTMAATILLGLIGGFFAAARSLQRVDWLGTEMSRIVRGDPSQRLDVDSEKGQVKQLAIVMNQMLDQTESLMQGVRSVSDNIAHDLRTPLSRMRNQLSQLHANVDAERSAEVEALIVDCDALLTSFNAVLRISTLEAGSRYSGVARLDLAALLDDVCDLYEPVAQEKGIAFEIDAPGPCSCEGEADLLFQMFANVLDNAIKYTPEGGRVSVRLRASSGGGNSVSISDTGPGISAEHWRDVFRRFYRVEPSRSAQPGHGLGLSMAQAIAHYHSGSVDLENNNPGLRVVVNLP